jgi:hypothetical protein
MTIITKDKRRRINEITYRKLQERSGVLYLRALERWNRRPEFR